MVNDRRPTIAPASHIAPETLLLETAEAAEAAFGTGSAAHEFLRRHPGSTVIFTRATDEFAAVPLEGAGWPPPPAAWCELAVSFDAQRDPPVECTIDGAAVELERHSDGSWRPCRTESDG